MGKRTARTRIMAARAAVETAAQALAELTVEDLATDDQLAIAVKALRSIANADRSKDFYQGVARGALVRLGLEE